MTPNPLQRPLAVAALVALAFSLQLAPATAAPRERAVEQLPALMNRILESQEQIREHESRVAPIVERYDEKLTSSRKHIEEAATEDEATEALVDYVEAYNQRLEALSQALLSIRAPIARMYADARQLARAAADAKGKGPPEAPEERRVFLQDHFQGVAAGISTLGDQLGVGEEAAVSGAVLTAGWAAASTPEMPLSKLGPEAAIIFARRTEGLYARYQARTYQLDSERVAVRQLLELLIERQLARRMDTLFTNGGESFLGGLLSGEGRTENWLDLGDVVNRALGLPSSTAGGSTFARADVDRLEHFARGHHRN